jgi:hypothetical protein
MLKLHDLGNLGVGAGRCASKECHRPLHDYGMDRIMATSVLSTFWMEGIMATSALSMIFINLADVLGM